MRHADERRAPVDDPGRRADAVDGGSGQPHAGIPEVREIQDGARSGWQDGPDDEAIPRGRQAAAAGVQAMAARWRRAVERWSPVGLRGARTDPGRSGALALITVAALAAAAVAFLAWHGRPQVEPVRPPAVVAGPEPATTVGSTGSSAPLVVAVTGRVRRPGVVALPVGARVIDAVKAAGGPLPGTDLAMLNLARKVADGELVAVGVPQPAPPAGPGGTAAGAVVDLNTATLADLDTLPGVGPVLAQRILDWRTAHGPFGSVDQLGDVPGIGETRLAQLRDLVRV